MHVEQAQEVATGRGVKVAVIDSGVQAVEGLDVYGGLAIPGVSPQPAVRATARSSPA